MVRKLKEIPIGRDCAVRQVAGEMRLRLLDIGFCPGSLVLPIQECAGGGTRVYRVKDTLIALRHTEAACILVEEGMADA